VPTYWLGHILYPFSLRFQNIVEGCRRWRKADIDGSSSGSDSECRWQRGVKEGKEGGTGKGASGAKQIRNLAWKY
jgi:hypothetical protein